MQWDNIEVGNCYRSKFFHECCILLDFKIHNPRKLELEVLPGVIQRTEPGDRVFQMTILWLGTTMNGFHHRKDVKICPIRDWWQNYDLLAEV